MRETDFSANAVVSMVGLKIVSVVSKPEWP